LFAVYLLGFKESIGESLKISNLEFV